MKQQIDEAKILICVGTGGVGKTTISAAIGAMAAKQGRRVLVLTVDPSKRLKQTLQISDSGEHQKIPLPNVKGELWAAVMNPQKTFDDFVLRAATKGGDPQKIFKNKLYQQLSRTLGGSQEFTALENLYAAVQSEKYDLIVLDTPPAQHAIDFLQAPQKLASIFTEGVAKWFRDPESSKTGFLAGLFQTGTRQVLRILESLTGSEFMRQLGDFFSQIHSWQDQLELRAVESHRLLVQPQTHFILITGFDEVKFQEGERFAREIKKGGYRLTAMIVNRAHPRWFEELKTNSAAKASNELPRISAYKTEMRAYFEKRRAKIRELQSRTRQVFDVLEVPERAGDISNPEQVLEFADELRQLLENEKNE